MAFVNAKLPLLLKVLVAIRVQFVNESATLVLLNTK